MIAHELAHVAQQRRGAFHATQTYRPKGSFNFGKDDTATMIESTFSNAKTQPWIETITVTFDGVADLKIPDDPAGRTALSPTGTAVATYHKNGAALQDVSLAITGGATSIGLTDRGKFTVTEIKGFGFNDRPAARPEGEGPNRQYMHSGAASMHFAVFFHDGQALHIGNLQIGSHACVHMGTDSAAWTAMRQINYHSVAGLTRVHVSYDSSILPRLCCERISALGGHWAPNPCDSVNPKKCP